MLKNRFLWLFFLLIITNTKVFAAGYTCTVSANSTAFGNFNPLNYTSQTTSTTFTVTCTATAVVTVSGTITFSQGNSGSFSSRTMKANANALSYNLYKDSACTQVLGDGTGSTYTYALSGNLNLTTTSLTSTYTVYGKIPSQPTTAIGNYTDSIIITVTYQ